MFYWGPGEMVTVVSISLSVVGIYLSFDLTRVASGAPRGWYWVIGALLAFLAYQAIRLYYDTATADTAVDNLKDVVLMLCSLLLVAGLASLDFAFRKHLRATFPGGQSSSDRTA